MPGGLSGFEQVAEKSASDDHCLCLFGNPLDMRKRYLDGRRHKEKVNAKLSSSSPRCADSGPSSNASRMRRPPRYDERSIKVSCYVERKIQFQSRTI